MQHGADVYCGECAAADQGLHSQVYFPRVQSAVLLCELCPCPHPVGRCSAAHRPAAVEIVSASAVQPAVRAGVLHGHGTAAVGDDGFFPGRPVFMGCAQHAVDVCYADFLSGDHHTRTIYGSLQNESALSFYPLHASDPFGRRIA